MCDAAWGVVIGSNKQTHYTLLHSLQGQPMVLL